jgi:hypothetical protein
MPNGFNGSKADWLRVEAPLLRVDPMLQTFVAEHGLSLSKNYHDWPERSLKWNTGIERLIQLYLEDSHRVTFNLWLCASQDRSGARYWRREFLLKDTKLDDVVGRLPSLLEDAYSTVNSWTTDGLEFAK